jgi:hypothetical protein
VVDTPDAGGSPDCAGRPDFTPCRVVTTPDRDYDVCLRGTCVSPGCGDPSCTPAGPAFPLPDTGQRRCHSTTAATPCSGATCTSLCGQDAEHGWDTTHPAIARYSRSEPVAGEPVVDDLVTGLGWQGCARGSTGRTCDSGAAIGTRWVDALAYCDALSWGGFDDWRLPDMFEGHSLMDYGEASALDASVFPNAPTQASLTSTFYAPTPQDYGSGVWLAPFSANGGEVGVALHAELPSAAASYAVRCVRTKTGFAYPASPRERDTRIAAEPIVVDRVSGLSFQGCLRGQTGPDCAGLGTSSTWSEALDYCHTLSWAGFGDWRLPNVKELRSIVDNSRPHAAPDPTLFPRSGGNTWTSTTNARDPKEAFMISLSGLGGGVQGVGKASRGNVRCVR